MREDYFIKSMMEDEKITSKEKAVKSRTSKAHKVENSLEINFDNVVKDDNLMLKTLIRIKNELNDSHGNLSNTLRKYYYYVNKKQFPKINNISEVLDC